MRYMMYKFELNGIEVDNVEIENIDMKDYPDFCDAYISAARFKFNNKALNDDQLSELMNNNPMAMHEAVNEEMLELADRYI